VLPSGAHQVTWPGAEASVKDALTGFEAQVTGVWAVDPESGGLLFHIPGLPGFLNTLQTVHPGEMLWLVVDGDEPVVLGTQ
jgi:hypothetical protein